MIDYNTVLLVLVAAGVIGGYMHTQARLNALHNDLNDHHHRQFGPHGEVESIGSSFNTLRATILAYAADVHTALAALPRKRSRKAVAAAGTQGTNAAASK